MTAILLSLFISGHYSLLLSIFLLPIETLSQWSTPAYHSKSCSEVHRSCNDNRTMFYPKTLYCSCSFSCTRFGDCCMDNTEVEDNDKPFYQCIHPSFSDDFKSYLMIAKCPTHWEDHETRHLCETPTQDGSDRIRSMPVSSVYSNATYRNIYCAICHDDLTALVSWRIAIQCQTRALVRLNISEIFEACSSTDYRPPSWVDDNYIDNHVVHFCNERIVSTCHSSRTSADQDALVKNCSRYFEPVQTADGGVIYKNVYCAKCNGLDVDKLLCPDLKNLMFERPDFTYASHPPIYVIGSRVHDLSVLLSIDTSRGSAITRDPPKCPPNHVYVKWTKAEFRINSNDPTVKDYTCIKIRTSSGNRTAVRKGKSNGIYSETEINCPKKMLYTNYSLNSSTGTVQLSDMDIVLENGSYKIFPNLSILVCLSELEITRDPFAELKSILSIVCSSISLLGLFLKVLFYYAIPEQKTVPNKSINMLSVSLFTAQLLFLVGLEQVTNFHLCLILASMIHYFFLVAFCWMNVLAYDLHRTFSSITRMKSSKKKFALYNLYAWFMPLIAVVPAIIFDRFLDVSIRPGFGESLCWFANRTALLVFFAAPLACILAANLFFFSTTAFRIYRTTKETKIARRRSTTSPESEDLVLFRLYVKLALIMGLTWILGFVAAFASSIILWCSFIVFNGLQGAFIFLAFTDFRLRSRVVRIRLGLQRLRSDTSSNQHRSSMETKTSDVQYRSKL